MHVHAYNEADPLPMMHMIADDMMLIGWIGVAFAIAGIALYAMWRI